MDMGSQKRIAARIMKCGVSRVRIRAGEDVDEALTREDIRGLIQKGSIWSLQKKGTSKFASKKKLEQKRKGRMRGPGRRKGTKGARKNDKTKWIEKVRPLRSLLSELRENGQIRKEDYGLLYKRIKGGFFRNRKHLLYYLKEHDMLQARKTGKSQAKVAKPKASIKSPVKKVAKGAAKKAKAVKVKAAPKAKVKKAKTKKPATMKAVKANPGKAPVRKEAAKKPSAKKTAGKRAGKK